jgi:N-acetylmuramoyl-L-alanine amidase
MFTITKNGKHHTNYINRFIIPVIVLCLIFPSAQSPSGKSVREGFVIVIDPGHGGKDPGAVGSFSSEKNITLSVALKAGAAIEQNIKNAKVIYTRKTDSFLGLNERAELANKNKADLFISIHANAHQLKSTYGAETYVMGHSKDDQNLEVAMKENEVILLESDYSTNYEGFDPKSPESYIMFTLMQNAFSEFSLDLAARLQSEYKTEARRFDRGVKQAGFWVLWKSTMPSILTEIGFITNTNEEKYINSKEGQEVIANSIFKACQEYLADIERKSSLSAVKPEPEPVQNTTIPADAKSQPDKIIFMVQIATSSKRIGLKPENFKNTGDLSEIQSGGRYRYATGKFEDYSGAVEYRKQMERIYPDAFVIAVKNNKILPLQEALENNGKKSK